MVDFGIDPHFDGTDLHLVLDSGSLTTSNTVKGDSANPLPLSALIVGDPTKPVTALIEGDPTKPVTTLIQGDPNRPLFLFLEGDPSKPIAFAITELPQINLSADIGIKPTRIHNPAHFTFCISIFGFELLRFHLCGEAMTIIEPYCPHKTEICY